VRCPFHLGDHAGEGDLFAFVLAAKE